MATTTKELRRLVEIGKTDEVVGAVVADINDTVEKYKQIKDMGDRMAANGLAFTVIENTTKNEIPPFIVEVIDGKTATIYENGVKTQEDAHEFMADKVTNLDEKMMVFEYGGKERIQVLGLHCLAREIKYPAA